MPWRLKSAARKRPANNLLERISRDDFQLIAPHLVDTELAANQILYNSGDTVSTVYFPCMASSASFAVSFEEGREVQTVLIGREGAVAVSSTEVVCRPMCVWRFGPEARSPAFRSMPSRRRRRVQHR
jgi:hypothetical protein